MHVLVHRRGDADAAGFRQRLETACYVDAVSMDIIAAGDDIAEIDANAQFDALRVSENCIPLGHRLLQCDGASHRLDSARELHQNAVAFDPDDPARMRFDIGSDDVPQHILQTQPSADFVPTGEAAIADHIGK